MDGGIDENAVLDFVVFHVSPTQNSYEAVVCSKDKTEKLAIGPLDRLALHLLEASSPSGNNFKLQLTENLKGSSWFTKSTLARFLHIVNTPEAVESANAIQTEMSQLEETKRFHLALYAKGHPDHAGDGTTDCSEEAALTQKVKVETALSDATKNELLRAVDLRFTALEEEFAASFNRALGAPCSTKQIYDLVAFAQHFGEVNLRNCLLKYLALISKDQPGPIIDQSNFSQDPRNNVDNKTGERSLPVQLIDIVKPAISGISPAKIAQAERRSSTDSEESSESSDEERASAERSRSLNRAAPARRSASPMRRIQIGKSGSRRSTALTIKSLNYFPARERTFNRDADGTNSGDEEPDQPAKKPENSVRRMSVQDAISLFENKQKDQILDVEKRKPSVEVSVSTNKTVLRRWSSGMGDSFTHSSNENASDAGVQNSSKNLPLESEEKSYIEVKAGSDSLAGSSNTVEATEISASSEVEMITSPLADGSAEMGIPKTEEVISQATASAEWNRQKEAELNQMLMKMMESKPGKYRSANASKVGCQDISSEQKGGSYSQYKEKRDEKLRAENARLRATKEARFKVMQESFEQSKAEMASKAGAISGKQNPTSHSQRPRRNSSPPVLPKNEISKSTGSRKASPRSASLSGTHSSCSSGPLPRTTATPSSKPSPRTISTNSTPNHRKAKPTPSPAKASLRTETPPPQKKGTKGTQTDAKSSLKNQVEKQQKAVTQTTRSVKTRSPSASGDDSLVKSSKPSFYNKVTKKSSVVPVESKPFLRKRTGSGPGLGPVLAKTKISQSDVSSKHSGNLVQAEETEPTAVTAVSTTTPVEHVLLTHGDADEDLEVPLPVVNDIKHETGDNSDTSFEAVESNFSTSVHPIAEIQPDEDMGISSAAWVEVEHPEVSATCDNGQPGTAISPEPALVASTSPRVRHSLSQMLLADSSEPDTIEWGNAENPPAFVYQKDAPKGLKRLLKFARKSKGDANATGWSSPSVFSEGEDDTEESKAASKRSSDNLLRKAALQATAYGQQKNMLSESFDGESKRALDYRGMHDILSAQSNMNHVPDKLRDGHISSTATSTKATRSFFSLSTFRSGKSSEPKLR